MILSILDNDLYKFTMQQAALMLYPRAQAEYEFTNRGATPFPHGFADRVRQEMHQDPWLAALPASYEQTSKHAVRPAIRASDRTTAAHVRSLRSNAEQIFATKLAD